MDDAMDIDQIQIVEVPDTPDRFPKQGINVVKVENHRSSYTILEQPKFSDDGTRDQPMLIDSGSRGRPMHTSKRTNSPSNSRRPNTFAVFPSASSSSTKALFRKGVAEKNTKHPSHESSHNQHLLSMRPPCTVKSSSDSHSDGFPDPTEGNLHRPVIENASKSGNQGVFQKRTGLTRNGTSSHSLQNLSISSSDAGEGASNVIGFGSSITCKEGVDCVGNDNKKPGSGGFRFVDPFASPRVNRQKRLVRNGCISPNNIAKVKQVSGKEIDGSVAVAHNDGAVASSAPPISNDFRELVAEDSDSHTKKVKGVISVPCSSKGISFQNKNLHSRSPMSFSEKTGSTDESGSGGCRSTHNRPREIINITSPEHVIPEHVRPLREPLYPRARPGRPNVPCSADLLIERQKQGSNSSVRGDCSTPVSDDPEVFFLSSSTEAGNSNSTSSNIGNLQQIIEVDELSPQLRRNAHDEDVKTRQLEADLAIELQEQFYNEVTLSREVDEHVIPEHVFFRPLRKPLYPRARPGRPNVPRSADLLIERQKQGSNSSVRGECSTPVSDDPEVVFLSSSTEAGNSNSTSSNIGNLQQIIEVDELSPQPRRNAHDEDVKTRQLEADLAIELQEQFYNEVTLSREVDEHVIPEHVFFRPLRKPLYPRARPGRPNVPRSADLLIERQKQGSNSSVRGECSTPVSDDPEVVFLSSSTEAGKSNSTSSNIGNLQQIIEVDELSPQPRRNAHDEDVKTRQLEADLARELQEQFYNEVPLSREVDEQIALALRHLEGSSHGCPPARLPVPNARSTYNLHRQFQSRPSPNAPRRAMTRAATLGRMTRMGNRFPGPPRSLLASRGRTSMFPPDMRMHILGALEDLSDMGVGTSILQADRDFNESRRTTHEPKSKIHKEKKEGTVKMSFRKKERKQKSPRRSPLY